MISDFHESGWSHALTRLALRHQVLAIAASDPRERSLPAVGLLTLVDPETGRSIEVQTASEKLRQRYAEAAAAQAAERRSALRRTGASVVELSTDRDWLLDIVRYVAASRRQRTGVSAGVVR